jgi:glycosyltransferase involved in cell wall biosynthesis
MRIGITTFGLDGGKSGMSRYLLQLLPHFAAGQDQWELLALRSERDVFDVAPEHIPIVEVAPRWGHPVANIAWHQWGLDRLCRRRGYDALFVAAGNRRVPFRLSCPTVGTVHDFAHLHVQGKYDAAHTFYQDRVLPFMVRRLDRVIAISESGKRDIVEHAGVDPDRISVIYHGADIKAFYPRQRSTCAAAMAARYDIRPPYIFYISRLEHPAKNHVRLIRAFTRLKRETGLPHSLVLAGAEWHGAEAVHQARQDSEVAQDISYIGFTDQEDLPQLYCGADLFACPSLVEGFGLPLLEAMACGTPVVCADASSLPEVAGKAAVLFDPLDEEAMAKAMAKVLENESLRADMVQQGLERSRHFTWEKSAAATTAVIHMATKR